MTTYGYARVSTNAQSLDEQIEQLEAQGIEPNSIYSEKFTGTKTNRPQFNKVLKQLNKGDTLVVTKLDRLARNSREALDIIEPLLDNGIEINVLNVGKLNNSTVGKLTYQILLAVAEMERNTIVERTQAGKEYAKKHNKNYKEGRPKRTITKYYMNIYKYLKNGHSYTETERYFNISRSTIYRIKKQIEQDK
ncbi:DNA invertase Pin [Fructilactobacillus sanfranciscensis]|uniref:recombinase family protein n=2 Tax=Fructilactobacillus sanfranciscensis TaxID=1625 RepID=UPI000CD3AF80|nr:recombinase family protein [Fructilactobacillus sanfranciscensis]POH11414.1 DNA invertase Pin [Fructilactobacillus sanfranciscensis]